jgi:hypothetical protein
MQVFFFFFWGGGGEGGPSAHMRGPMLWSSFLPKTRRNKQKMDIKKGNQRTKSVQLPATRRRDRVVHEQRYGHKGVASRNL